MNMKQLKTNDNQEWLELRKKYIGASEIASAVYQYKKEEYERIIGNRQMQLPFIDDHCLYNIKKCDYRHNIKDEYVKKGEFAEKEVIPAYLKEHMPFLKFKMNYENVISINDKYPNLSCTPDGFLELEEGAELFDINGNAITKEDGEGVLECKFTCEFIAIKNYGTDCPDQYLLQLSQQQLVCDAKWGMLITCIEVDITKDNERDDYFLIVDKKGYKIEYFIYKRYTEIKKIIIEANDMFIQDMQNNIVPKPIPESKFIKEALNIQKEKIQSKFKSKEFKEEEEEKEKEKEDRTGDEELEEKIRIFNEANERRKQAELEEDIAMLEMREMLLDRKTTQVGDKLYEWSVTKVPSKEVKEYTDTRLKIKNA